MVILIKKIISGALKIHVEASQWLTQWLNVASQASLDDSEILQSFWETAHPQHTTSCCGIWPFDCHTTGCQSRNARQCRGWKLNELHPRSQGYYGNGWELRCYIGQKVGGKNKLNTASKHKCWAKRRSKTRLIWYVTTWPRDSVAKTQQYFTRAYSGGWQFTHFLENQQASS